MLASQVIYRNIEKISNNARDTWGKVQQGHSRIFYFCSNKVKLNSRGYFRGEENE
jgi:hypothetical protein